MKATELMIGDWVQWKPSKGGFIGIVGGDRALAPQFEKVKLSHLNSSLNDYYPIPLTPEILEKNGFKDAPAKDTDVHNLVGKWWHKSGDVYVKKYCLSHGTYAYTIGFHPHTRIENIHNVHEVQHALRLCRLNDLADNFKI